MSHQDWEPVTIRRSGAGTTAPAGTKPHQTRTAEAVRLAKLEAADVPVRQKVLTAESVAAIQAYRRTENLTQKQMDQRLSLPAGTINGLESRRATPPSAVLRALNQLLKTGLTLE